MEGQVLALDVSLGESPAFTIVGQVTWINDPQSPKRCGAHRSRRGGRGVLATALAHRTARL